MASHCANRFDQSQFDWIFFSDGDLQFNLAELDGFVGQAQDFDFILGTRVKRADNLLRRVNQQLLRIWAYLFFGLPLSIRDVNCAFKLLKAERVRGCLPLLCNGAMVTTELLLKAHRCGVQMVQLPVSHLPRVRGKQTGARADVIARAVRETFLLREALRVPRL